jgi:hypothetical protein
MAPLSKPAVEEPSAASNWTSATVKGLLPLATVSAKVAPLATVILSTVQLFVTAFVKGILVGEGESAGGYGGAATVSVGARKRQRARARLFQAS